MSSFERQQACPNCFRRHDVSVYVSGQKLSCACGIRFEVVHTELKAAPDKPAPASPKAFSLPPKQPQPLSAQQQTRVAPLKPPDIDGYALLEMVGQGGMGEVWRAEQISLKRPVAIKLLPTSYENTPEFVGRFEKEASALALLSHPNIVQVIDRGVAGSRYYIVMEYVSGPSLREKMSQGRLPLQESLQLLSTIARAVDYMHTQAVIHRDIKPENILLDATGNVKVADFGLAGIRGAQELALTATAVAMGSVNYMAPEQRKDAKHVDCRADIYALGIILYEMLTGELPVGRFKMPSETNKLLPRELDEVVAHLLQTSPEARPSRALWIAERLEAISQKPPEPRQGRQHQTRHLGLWGWLLIALVGGLLAYLKLSGF